MIKMEQQDISENPNYLYQDQQQAASKPEMKPATYNQNMFQQTSYKATPAMYYMKSEPDDCPVEQNPYPAWNNVLYQHQQSQMAAYNSVSANQQNISSPGASTQINHDYENVMPENLERKSPHDQEIANGQIKSERVDEINDRNVEMKDTNSSSSNSNSQEFAMKKDEGTSTSDDIVRCPHCRERFYAPELLQTHIRESHLLSVSERGITPVVTPSFACPICGKTFKARSNLRQHNSQVHPTADACFQCPQCHKIFKAKANLWQHVLQVHPSNDAGYECTQCSKVFKAKANLRQHVRVVHPAEDAAFGCKHCTKVFKAKSNLQQHIKHVHPANDPGFQCAKCEKKYKMPHYLQLHMKQAHNEEIDATTVSISTPVAE